MPTLTFKPIDDVWNSGEEIPVILNDADANKNTRFDEDLDLNNPNVSLIPSVQIGNPFTLEALSSATLAGENLVIDDVQIFSQRAMLRVSSENLSLQNGTTLILETTDTFNKLYESIHDPSGAFTGANVLNYDIRSIYDATPNGFESFNVDITDGVNTVRLNGNPRVDPQGNFIITDAVVATLFSMNINSPVRMVFSFQFTGTLNVPEGTIMPIVCDFFSFGKINDGAQPNERISNMIARLELEENGDNTSEFEGELEFVMLNQLNIIDLSTYDGIWVIADDPMLIVPNGLTDENSIRVNYNDLAADGTVLPVADQEEAPSHSGVVSFDFDTYKVADTVEVTLEDQDLNIDSDLREIYTVVSDPDDPARDAIGAAGLGLFTTNNLGAFGRLLEITFDDQRWIGGQSANGGACGKAGTPDDGLAATGFTLVETNVDSGVFVGDFAIPETYCRLSSGTIESTIGTDIEVNYVDYSDAAGGIIEVGDGASIRAHTGSVTLDRTVYPLPFGGVEDFFPGDAQSGNDQPINESLFPIHNTGVLTDGDQNIDANIEEIGPRDLMVHVRVDDPDFDISPSGEDMIAFGEHGPIKVMIHRGSDTIVLATAGGEAANDGVITVGANVIPGVTRELGPVFEIAPDSGIFELDLPIRYTDGPPSVSGPDTPDAGYSSLNGDNGVLGRFNQLPINGDYCILQGDILSVEYTDPAASSGEANTVTDSGTFDLRNGILQSDRSVYIIGRDMIFTLIEPDLNLDSDRAETYSLDLIEWDSDASTLTMGEVGGETSAFNPEPMELRETGDNTGIFQVVVEMPDELSGDRLERAEEIVLEYVDWGAKYS